MWRLWLRYGLMLALGLGLVATWVAYENHLEAIVITSTTSEVYHRPACRHVRRIDPLNIEVIHPRQATARGLRPCRTCRP